VVQIPEADPAVMEVILEDAPSPSNEPSWPAAHSGDTGNIPGFGDPASDPLADPLNLGGALQDLSSFGAPASDQMPAPQSSAYGSHSSYTPQTKTATSPAAKEAGTKPAYFWPLVGAMAGGGVLAGLLCVGLVGWLLFGGRDKGETAADVDAATMAAMARANAPTPAQPAAAQPTSETPDSQPQAPPAATVEAPPVQPADPWDLKPVELDQRLIGFQLPGVTWAAAYDEPTGRLALTNDDNGILVYDIDELLKGNLRPAGSVPTRGLPTAVCWKPLSDRRLFVIAGKDDPNVLVVDIESLMPVQKIQLLNLDFIDSLVGSANPQDPYVYYTTQRYDRGNRETADRLGRIELAARQQEELVSEEEFTDVVTSPDGQLLFARPSSTADGVIATCNKSNDGASVVLTPLGQWGRNGTPGPVSMLGDAAGLGNSVYSPRLTRVISRPEYQPKAAFQDPPVVVGLNEEGIVFGSANDYRPLDTVPLPAGWKRERRRGDQDDFRLRVYLSEYLNTRFLEVHADNTRKLGLLVLGEHLVIAPLDRLQLPTEPSLRVQTQLPDKLPAGELFEVSLASAAPDVTFEIVNEEAGRDARQQDAATDPSRIKLPLAASVNKQQNLILLNDLSPLSGMTLPITIQIDDEQMKVVAIDDFRTALTVERTAGVAHSVSSPVVVFKNAPVVAAPAAGLPTIEGRTVRWTPVPTQLGRQAFRLRAKSGNLAHDWYWEVAVEQTSVALPFLVRGIEPDAEGNRAVVWGQALAPAKVGGRAVVPEPNTYYLGIYDLKAKQLLQHVETPKPIQHAALHSTGVYASLMLLDPARPTTDAPTQIVRFHPETLAVEEQTECPTHGSVIVIGDRYLAVTGRQTVRLTIPDLKPVTPTLGAYPYPIAGRLRDGWVWDGIVWDEAMKKPRLLLFPVLFEGGLRGADSPQMVAAQGGTIWMLTRGPCVGTWFPGNPSLGGQYLLRGHTAALSCAEGRLQAYSWADTSRVRVTSEVVPDATVPLLDTAKTRLPDMLGSDMNLIRDFFTGYIAELAGQVHVALLGKLYSVPLDSLVRDEQPFRFVEQQDIFVLEAGKTNKLQYSAPGAVRYHFQLWLQRPHFHDDTPFLALESADGSFEVNLEAMEQFAGMALSNASVGGRTTKEKTDSVNAYLKRIAPAYQSLTGKRPRSLSFPVYASVIAEHQDGRQKAGLAHSYLIEVPAKEIQKLLAQ